MNGAQTRLARKKTTGSGFTAEENKNQETDNVAGVEDQDNRPLRGDRTGQL